MRIEAPVAPALRAVLLDTGPLGVLSNPRASETALACRAWVGGLTAAGVRVIVPEICDSEVRRELHQARLTGSLRTLDQLLEVVGYLALDTPMMRHAARLWAEARHRGRPTADRHALDGDVILAAQALALGLPPAAFVVATGNAGHLAQFVPARDWPEIA